MIDSCLTKPEPTEKAKEAAVEVETTNEPAMPVKAASSPSQSAQRTTYGPKKDSAPTYGRLEIEKKPARHRSLFGRMQVEQRDSSSRRKEL